LRSTPHAGKKDESSPIEKLLKWSALVDDFRTFVASCDLDNRRQPNDNSRLEEIKVKEKKLLRGIDRKLKYIAPLNSGRSTEGLWFTES
jgi:hypothetical protein